MAGIDLETVSRLARTALRAGDAYLFGRVVPVLAEAEPHRAEWILAYVRVLGELGLGTAAHQLLSCFDEDLRRSPEISELERSIRSRPSGLVPWTSRRRRFEANLAALSAQDAAAADQVLHVWPEASQQFEMHACTDGNVQIRRCGPPWPPRWWPALDDHRARAPEVVNARRTGLLPPPLVFEGVGLGWEVLEGFDKTTNVFLQASAALFVIEPDPTAVALVFHLHDWRAHLRCSRFRLFVGSDAGRRLAALLESDTRWPVADRVCSIDSPTQVAPVGSGAIMAAVAGARAAKVEEITREITRRYDGRDARYWAARFADAMEDNGRAAGRPLRVLGITSLHTTFLQFSMRDCLRAIERLGHRTKLLIEDDQHLCLDASAVLRAQLEFEPDVVLLLSRMRYEMPQTIPSVIPSITWDQDSLPWVFDASCRPQLAWNDFLMGFTAITASRKFGWASHRCRNCKMAGSVDTYCADPLPESQLAPLRCDLSYVSHASATVEQELVHVDGWLAEVRLRDLFRATVEHWRPRWRAGEAFPGPTMATLVDLAERQSWTLSPEERAKVSQAVQRVGDRLFRHQALEWVADWADRTGAVFRLWGNGWEQHPRLARYARGSTRNGHELRCVYQASKVNLQLMGFGFLHQRALDGLMAGAFFMTRRCPADDQGPAIRELAGLLEQHSVRTRGDLAALTEASAHSKIEACMAALNIDPRVLCEEAVDYLRACAGSDYAAEVVPRFSEISFTSASEFAAKAAVFLADADVRQRYATQMREALVSGYSYEARMAEMLTFLRDGFRAQAAIGQPFPSPVKSDASRSLAG